MTGQERSPKKGCLPAGMSAPPPPSPIPLPPMSTSTGSLGNPWALSAGDESALGITVEADVGGNFGPSAGTSPPICPMHPCPPLQPPTKPGSLARPASSGGPIISGCQRAGNDECFMSEQLAASTEGRPLNPAAGNASDNFQLIEKSLVPKIFFSHSSKHRARGRQSGLAAGSVGERADRVCRWRARLEGVALALMEADAWAKGGQHLRGRWGGEGRCQGPRPSHPIPPGPITTRVLAKCCPVSALR